MLRSILITLAVAAGDGTPPTEVCLLKPGANQTRKGAYIFDDAAAASVMDAYRAQGQTDLPIDWEHASLSASRAPDPKKAGEACGWFNPFAPALALGLAAWFPTIDCRIVVVVDTNAMRAGSSR